MYKKYCALIMAVAVAMCALAAGCDKSEDSSSQTASTQSSAASQKDDNNSTSSTARKYSLEELGLSAKYFDDKDHEVGYQLESPDEGDEIAIIHTNMGDITMRFFPDAAPQAVENFITLSKDGYYDGVIFHRIIDGFMIQGGDPTGTGTGGESVSGKDFGDEFSNKLFNIRGSVAMANKGPDTNSSQFFINQCKDANFELCEANWNQIYDMMCQVKDSGGLDSFLQYYNSYYTNFYNTDMITDDIKALYKKEGGNPQLDGAFNMIGRGHTVFAQVIDGMDVVDAIAAVETDSNNKPLDDVIIETVEITNYSK